MWQRFRRSSKKPDLPDGLRIYAIGDIHGRADLLERLFAAIDLDLAQHPALRTSHVLLGDYIDRGPCSRGVIDLILQRAAAHEVIALKGNHDVFPLRILEEPSVIDDWRPLGGFETLMSYGLTPALRMDDKELRDLAAEFEAALSTRHAEFFRQLKPSFSSGDFFFAHAGVMPRVPLEQQREEDLLWIRGAFLGYDGDFGKIVVHGHTPVREIDFRSNRINVDTGAYATGRLSALVIEGNELRTLDTGEGRGRNSS